MRRLRINPPAGQRVQGIGCDIPYSNKGFVSRTGRHIGKIPAPPRSSRACVPPGQAPTPPFRKTGSTIKETLIKMKKHIWAASLLPTSLSAEPLNWWKPYSAVNSGDTAWVMTAAALVLLMTLPGLALFYGGMVRKKPALDDDAQLFHRDIGGHPLGRRRLFFSVHAGNAFIGGLGRVFLSGMQIDATAQMLTVSPNAPTVPEPVFMFFR